VSSRLPPDLLDRSAEESSRLLALNYLDQIDSAEKRLEDTFDLEALHDFRVGLRRLRSSVRAYRPQLEGSVSGKMRKQLRALAQATNEGRDTEVQLAWLAKQSGQVAADDVPGFFWFSGRLEGHKQETLDRETADVARRYQKVAGKLRDGLAILRIDLAEGGVRKQLTFGEVTGGLVQLAVIHLGEELSRVISDASVEEAHEARIAVKRLRYLLEPVARLRAQVLIPRLKEAQDILGEHHDMHVLAAEIAAARADLPRSGFSGMEPGLITLERLAREQAAAAFDRFQKSWSGALAGRILARATEIGRTLAKLPMKPPAAAEPPAIPEPAVSSNPEPARPLESETG
jgi:CHAD domain-containing protein